jgi:hypothetical protein
VNSSDYSRASVLGNLLPPSQAARITEFALLFITSSVAPPRCDDLSALGEPYVRPSSVDQPPGLLTPTSLDRDQRGGDADERARPDDRRRLPGG